MKTAKAIMLEMLQGTPWTPTDIRGHRRDKQLVKMRHAIWARVQAALGWSLSRLGKFFHRDHTSILNGIHRHNNPTDESERNWVHAVPFKSVRAKAA